ncbi:MAG: M48 family metalloprotease [Vicinamibacterales bacterium]
MNEPKAVRYQRHRRRASVAAVLSGTAAVLVASLPPISAWMSGAAARLALGLPAPLADVTALLVVVAALVLIWQAAALPARLHFGRRVQARYGPDPAPPVERIVSAQAQAALLLVPVLWAAALAVRLSVRLAGDWWWLAIGAGLGGLIVGALHAAPAVIGRLAGAQPLRRDDLAARLADLAGRCGVPVREFLALPDGAGPATAAIVTGLGRSRRVFLSAEILRDWSDDEIAVVVAHELGHHAHRDLWRSAALDAGILSAGLCAAAAVVRVAGPRLGVAGAADLAALPIVALVVGAVWLGATPLRHAQSRRHERRADAYALARTGHVEAFDTAIRRLGQRHLAEERPAALTRWLFHRHPPVSERLEFARAYRAARDA